MAGFYLSGCPEFEGWLQIRRESLHRSALTLLTTLSDTHNRNGNPGRALAFAQRNLELDPFDEAALCRSLRINAAMKRTAAAVNLYQDFARRLRDELGIQPGNTTRALFESIAHGDSATNLSAGNPAEAMPLSAPAERRQVTVLYCELGNATDDPEDAMDQLKSPQAQFMHIIRRNGGHISRMHGASLLAYFGYPSALENAARLAAHTAMELSRATPRGISARFSLHTGLIITGEDQTVPDTAGLTSNITMHLCAISGTELIVASAATHALLAKHFVFRDMGLHRIEGARREMGVYSLLGESGAFSLLDAAQEFAPFVGRCAELERLQHMYQTLRDRKGVQAVLLHGEAGIGKSRFLRRFTSSLSGASDPVPVWQCNAQRQGETLYPFKAYLANACGFMRDDDDSARLAKLQHFFAAAGCPFSLEKLAPLARLFSPATESRNDTQESMGKSGELFALPLEFLRSGCGPDLLLVEDLQWADSSTMELLQQLLTQPIAATLLILTSARSGFTPPWGNLSASIEIPPLSETESATLAGFAFGEKLQEAETVARIVRAADGVPLFIEEIARMLRDDTCGAGSAFLVPATLRDLLMARLDRQDLAKPVAQAAAVIGREFGMKLLSQASGHPPQLEESLRHLEKAGLILRLGIAVPPRYRFKHALIQETAYFSLSRQSRREIHGCIAHALADNLAQEDAPPEVKANHFFHAGDFPNAASWWFVAGKTSLARCAYGETLLHCRGALEALAEMPLDIGRDKLKLNILLAQGSALIAVKGYGAQEVNHVYSETLALSKSTGTTLDLFRSIWGVYMNCSSHATHRDAMDLAHELLRLAQQNGRYDLLIAAHHACTLSSFYLGNFDDSRQHLEEVRRLYRPEFDEALLSSFGEHALVSSLAFGVWLFWITGRPSKAHELGDEALSTARRLNHPYSLCFALCAQGIFHQQLDVHAAVGKIGGEIAALAEKHGYALWQVIGEIFLGWEQAALGLEQGLARIAAAINLMRSGVYQGGVSFFLKILADAFGKLGLHAERLAVIEEIFMIVALKHDHFFDAELLRSKGECLLHLGDPAQAEACLVKALEFARRQGAATLALHAADSLGELWRSRGNVDQADKLQREIRAELPSEPYPC